MFQTMLSFIISKVNKHRIDSTNKSRRGISDVQNIDMHSVVSQINLHGTTIASVSGAIKLNFLLEYLRVMSHEEFATICFSRNCNQLLHHLQNNGYDFVSPGINGFDPFFGFSENEICSIIRQSVSSINGISITNDAIQYLRGVLGYLSIKGIPIGLQNISRCIQTHLQIGSKNYDSPETGKYSKVDQLGTPKSKELSQRIIDRPGYKKYNEAAQRKRNSQHQSW